MIFTYALADAILEGRKTVTRRPVWSGKPGRRRQFVPPAAGELLPIQRGYAKACAHARITSVTYEPHFSGGVSELEAIQEGFGGAVEFRDAWQSIYGGESIAVWRIEFAAPEQIEGQS